jgi:hypothetical protein
MHIQVYELIVPPMPKSCQKSSQNRGCELTSIVQDTPLRPVLDDHGQWPDAIIDLNIQIDHARVLKRGHIVDVHVTGELQLRIPDFYYPDLGCRYADDAFHAI